MDALAKDNLAYWTEAVAVHLASPFYRTEAFRKGEIVLDPLVRRGIGDVAGKRLLHQGPEVTAPFLPLNFALDAVLPG